MQGSRYIARCPRVQGFYFSSELYRVPLCIRYTEAITAATMHHRLLGQEGQRERKEKKEMIEKDKGPEIGIAPHLTSFGRYLYYVAG